MEFYRTYITKFKTESGIKVYAGKHISKYENADDDPYYGSGTVIRRAVKKYGKSCICETEWFDHISEDDMNSAEIATINECKFKYMDRCVNIASGGQGGNTTKFASPERKAELAIIISESGAKARSKRTPERIAEIKNTLKVAHANRTPEQKAKNAQVTGIASKVAHANRTPEQKATTAIKLREIAKATHASRTPEQKAEYDAKIKSGHAKQTPEQKAIVSKNMRDAHANQTPEQKAARSATNKLVNRKSPVWHEPLYSKLWDEWNAIGRPKWGAFRTHCRKNNITELYTGKLVGHFMQRYEEE